MPSVADLLASAGWGAPFTAVDDPDGARLVVALRLRAEPAAAERALLALHRGLRRLAGEYGPRSVDLPGDPAGDPHGYPEAFGAKVRFRRSTALLRLPAGVLYGPVGHRPGVERSDTAWRVRRLLTEGLGTGAASLGAVSRAIAVHPRTLQRTLADEGLSFGEILDCVRRERARADLLGTDRPLVAISATLGFAEPSVLTRCARRWWGTTPSGFRLVGGYPAASDRKSATIPAWRSAESTVR